MSVGDVHVVPVGDLVEHDTDGPGCVCVPRVEPVQREDGTIGYILVHLSLDGRELNEPSTR